MVDYFGAPLNIKILRKIRISGRAVSSTMAILITAIGFQNCQNGFRSTSSAIQVEASVSPALNSGVHTYTWVGTSWSSCSALCGGGVQARLVTCQQDGGGVVDSSNCSGLQPAASQACNTEACGNYMWIQSGFGPCSQSCGGGNQTQTVTCENSAAQPVANSLCSGSAPASSQLCNPQVCSSSCPSGFSYNNGQCFPTPHSAQLNWFTVIDPFWSYGTYGGLARTGPVDYTQLFQPVNLWPNAMSHIQVFKVYAGAIISGNAQLLPIFNFLRQNGLALGVEFGPVTQPNGCPSIESYGGPGVAQQVVDGVKKNGGYLSFVAFDEPLYYAHYAASPECQISIPSLAVDVAQSVAIFRTGFPDVQIGDIEPSNSLPSMTDVGQWISAYQAQTGTPFSFFHDDGAAENSAWLSQTAALQKLLAAQAIPYGSLWTGCCGLTSDEEWMARTESRLMLYRNAGLATVSQNIFQSWEGLPSHALPETTSTSMTYLPNYAFSNRQNIFRFVSAKPIDHLLTLDVFEGESSARFSFEETSFRTLRNVEAGTVSLNRCYIPSANQHFLSTDVKCEGAGTNEGSLGFIYTGPTANAIALYRFFDPLSGDHLSTVDATEGQLARYQSEGIQGYAIPKDTL